MGGAYSKPAERPTKYFPSFLEGLPSLEGKVVAVTGCTSGTGLIVATAVAKKGGEVVMLNRKSERADAAETKVKEAAPGAKVCTVACDLSSFDGPTAAAAELKDKYPDGIDVLCCNAGVMALPDEANKDGYDVQMVTNHLSHFLLTRELMPLLEKAAERHGEARVVQMSSEARKGAPVDAKYYGKNGGKLGGDGTGSFFNGPRWQRYHQTKLANCVFTYALDEKLRGKGSKVKALVAHPGLSATNLQVTSSSSGGMGGMFTNMLMKMSMSAEDGAIGLLMACCSKEVQSGDFYGPAGFAGMAVKLTPEPILTDATAKKILWEESEKAVGPFVV